MTHTDAINRASLMLHRALDMAGISQGELARRAEINPSTMSKWLDGQHNMTVANLFRCIDACGLDIIELQVRRKPVLIEVEADNG